MFVQSIFVFLHSKLTVDDADDDYKKEYSSENKNIPWTRQTLGHLFGKLFRNLLPIFFRKIVIESVKNQKKMRFLVGSCFKVNFIFSVSQLMMKKLMK